MKALGLNEMTTGTDYNSQIDGLLRYKFGKEKSKYHELWIFCMKLKYTVFMGSVLFSVTTLESREPNLSILTSRKQNPSCSRSL